MCVIRVIQRNRAWNDPRQPRKPSRRSTAPGLAALLTPLRCLPRPGGIDRRSPFQSARSPSDPPAVPSGLKGRGPRGGFAATARGGRLCRPPAPGSPAFAAPCAASSGERRSPGDASTAANAVSEARSEPRDWSRPRAFEGIISSHYSPPRAVPYTPCTDRFSITEYRVNEPSYDTLSYSNQYEPSRDGR